MTAVYGNVPYIGAYVARALAGPAAGSQKRFSRQGRPCSLVSRKYSDLRDNASLMLLLTIVFSLLGTIVSLWILWAIIRGAVLSALRKHADEQRATAGSYSR